MAEVANPPATNGEVPPPPPPAPEAEAEAAGVPPPPPPLPEAPKEVETFAAEVGIIEPPPDIKLIVDRTADFVRRVGTSFEKEIMQRNAKSKKFGFLQPANPYWKYYQARLKFGENIPKKPQDASLPDAKGGAKESAANASAQTKAEEKKVVKKVVKKKVLTVKERMQAHIRSARTCTTAATAKAPNKYTIKNPPLIHAVDIDIIRLTSQFVARNGRSFLSGLTQREQRNPQFDFLKPTHPLFTFFQELVDAYAQIVIPPKKLLAEYRANLNKKGSWMKDCLERAKIRKGEQEEENKKEGAEEEERVAMALIDWHHFVCVEVITFERGEEEFLPRPRADVEEMTRMLDAQTVGGGDDADAGGGEEEDDEDMDMDMEMEDDDEDEDEDEEYEDEQPAVEEAPVVIPSSATITNEPEAELIKNFNPDELADGADERAAKFQCCPICGLDIPINELSEHMRIELLDDRWKEKKQRLADVQLESSLSASSSISANLKTLSRRRTDVFATDSSNTASEEKFDLRMKNAWEKHTQGVQATARKAAEEKTRREEEDRERRKRRESDNDRRQGQGNRQSESRGSAPPPSRALPPPSQPPPRPAMPPPPRAALPPPPRPSMPTMPIARPTMPTARPTMPRPPVALAPPAAALPKPPTPAPTHQPMPGPGGVPAARPPMQFNQFGQPMMMMPQMGGRGPPMMMMPGGTAPGGFPGFPGRPGPGPGQQPPAKKQRMASGGLLPEGAWLAAHPQPVNVRVRVPNEPEREWGFTGQALEFTFPPTTTITQMKKAISEALRNMPPAKMKINIMNGSFLNKDKFTLAHYNVKNGTDFQLGVRERGGRKR